MYNQVVFICKDRQIHKVWCLNMEMLVNNQYNSHHTWTTTAALCIAMNECVLQMFVPCNDSNNYFIACHSNIIAIYVELHYGCSTVVVFATTNIGSHI